MLFRSNCFNVGIISGTGTTTAAIASSNGGDTYEDCYYLSGSADTGVYKKAGAAVSKTTAEMKAAAFLTLINGDGAFAADSGNRNNGYPVLKFMASGLSSVLPGGGVSLESYGDLTVSAGTGGTVTVNTKSPEAGSRVTVTVQPDSGYDLAGVTVQDESNKAIKVEKNADGTYSFTMPSSKTTLTATFKTCHASRFSDVDTGKWYHEAVDYAVENGWFGGVSAAKFDPNGGVTRSMLAAVLYRVAGKPEAKNSAQFGDIPSDAWYAQAVAWAVEKGIVAGYTDGTFRPNDLVSRQQMAAFLYRYAQSVGKVSVSHDLSAYSDASAVAPYASQAMAWAVGAGVIQGTSASALSPESDVTRAQTAAILMRYAQGGAALNS